MSAHVGDTPLGCFLGWRFGLGRKLKHRCRLTFEQIGQEHHLAIGEFERIVMHPRPERSPS